MIFFRKPVPIPDQVRDRAFSGSCAIGIGGSLTTPPLPHHRTYGSRIRRFGGLSGHLFPQKGCRRGLETHNRESASVPALPCCQASPFSVDVQDGHYRLSAAWRLRVVRVYSPLPSVRAFGRMAPPTMPSADFCVAVRSPCDELSLVAETQRRPPEVRPTAFTARPPNLPPRSLMAVGFATVCSLARPGRPRYPVFVHRAAALLHASFRPCLAAAALALR